MLSTPAQMNTSPAPIAIAPAAMCTDCIELPQKRFTVMPATEIGRSASRPMMRPTFMPCSPSGKAQPMMTSSISSGRTLVRAISSRITCAARSSGRTRASPPFLARVNGERA